MQTMYIGKTKKVGDIDLKKNRVYLEYPAEIIENLKAKDLPLIEKLFVPIEKITEALKAVEKSGTPEFIANSKI